LLRSTGGIVDPIYLGSDLDHSDLQGDDSPVDCGDIRVQSLYLGDGIEAVHRLIEPGCRWLAASDAGDGPDSILKRSHASSLAQLPGVMG
jgi:hypothetical protein